MNTNSKEHILEAALNEVAVGGLRRLYRAAARIEQSLGHPLVVDVDPALLTWERGRTPGVGVHGPGGHITVRLMSTERAMVEKLARAFITEPDDPGEAVLEPCRRNERRPA